jgi:ABC-2 type transport system ATP-binding protein
MQAPVKNMTMNEGGGGTGLAERARSVATSRPPAFQERRAPASVVLEVENLTKSFRSGFLRRKLPGVEGVSFKVDQGSVFALIGHNGAGKTTTINCILDLVHADDGKISILGRDHRDPAARTRIGYLPERPYFFEHLSGRELLNFYSSLLDIPTEGRADRIAEVLDLVGMTAFAGRRLKKFSKGMLQRIGLAQAILGDPDILILDEPMSGLDPLGRRQIRELLMDLKRAGKTIILSSHIVQDVEIVADTVGVLKQGSLVDIRDLTELSRGFSYTGDLALEATAPDWLPPGCQDLRDGRVRVPIESVEEMRTLLNNCHRDGITVVSLAAHRSCLEEMFMAINRETCTRAEVAP